MVDPAGVAMTMENTLPQTSLREVIPDNTVPMLLVCGTWEKRFKPFRDYTEESMPHAEVVDFEAGHAVNIEASELFNESVVSFIKRHS